MAIVSANKCSTVYVFDTVSKSPSVCLLVGELHTLQPTLAHLYPCTDLMGNI